MKTKRIIVLLCFISFICSMFIFFVLNLNNPSDKVNDCQIVFKVEKGSYAKAIIKDLKKRGLIRSEYYAYTYLKLKKLILRAGSYSLNYKMTTQEILHALTAGTQSLKKITIPEGLTLKKTALLFEKTKLIDYNVFMDLTSDTQFLQKNGITSQTAEGFLYPDTYFFGEDDTPQMMLEMVFKTFFNKIAEIPNMPKDADELYKKLILASIIEREYQIPSEAFIISSVFNNRLKINMALQSCATVEYIITEIKNKKHPVRLFYEDLEIKSPYNTYIHCSLPPAPISNPGIIALNAACNPSKTDFLYFRLIDPDTGKHIFTKTIEEHNKAGDILLLKKAGKR